MICKACGEQEENGVALVDGIVVCNWCFSEAPLIDDKDFLLAWIEKRQENIMQMAFIVLIDYILYKGWIPPDVMTKETMGRLQEESFNPKSTLNKTLKLVNDENQSPLGKIIQHQIRLLDEIQNEQKSEEEPI